ncbi:restriction endonuclease subunit S [Acinetobacter pittii]
MASPKLRFKEFDGDWNQVKISDYSNTVTSGSRDWAQYYSDKGDKFIRMTNLVRDGIYLDLSDLRFVDLPKDSNEGKRTSLQSGDILISITAELGKLGWINSDLGTAYINQHTALVRMNENVDSKFIAYTLSTEKYNNKLNNLNDSGAKAGLNLGTIRNFELTIPQKKEQTKIASFLSEVDEKISQLTKKHALLSQYKQGMMQKLFSQQIRFKADDGSEFRGWEEGELGDITAIQGGYAFKSNSFGKGATKVLRIGDIWNNIFLDYFEGVYSDEIPDARYLVSNDDIVMALSGATFGKLGKVKTGSAYINQRVATFKVNEKTINEYVYQIMLSKDFFNYIQSIPSASAQPNISNQDVLNFEMLIPCLEEQTKIANFLSAIDQKIEVVTKQIEQAKQWKKGLLQQMFV